MYKWKLERFTSWKSKYVKLIPVYYVTIGNTYLKRWAIGCRSVVQVLCNSIDYTNNLTNLFRVLSNLLAWSLKNSFQWIIYRSMDCSTFVFLSYKYMSLQVSVIFLSSLYILESFRLTKYNLCCIYYFYRRPYSQSWL